jgi:hypothetical protein
MLWAETSTPLTIAPVTIDTSNGIATAWTDFAPYTIASGFSATCKSFNADFWRVEITFTGTAVNWMFYVVPAGTTNPTQSTGSVDPAVQGSAVFYGAQVELGSFASSYIPTTTATVTRAADANRYDSSINYTLVGSAYAEISLDSAIATNNRLISMMTGNGYPIYFKIGSSKFGIWDGVTEVPFGTVISSYPSSGNKVASSWGDSTQGGSSNGTVVTSGAFDGSMGTSNSIDFGFNGAWGNIKNVAIWNKKLPDSALQDITE